MPVRKKTCIIVCGMHRSGTSAVTRVVNLLGADIACDLMPAVAGDNDRGFWEPKAVVNIHDHLLHSLGSSYDDPLPLPDRWLETDAAVQAKRRLADEINKDFSDISLFVVKDPRITRLLPLWLALLDELGIEPVIVISVRNPLEVEASLNKRGVLSSAQSLLLYVRSYLEVELASRDRGRIFVQYVQLLSDWHVFAKRLGKVVGPPLPQPKAEFVAEINGFLTLDLYRNRSTREELASASHIADVVVEMFDRMMEAADSDAETALRTSFDRLRDTVAEATKLFQALIIAEREKCRSEVARLKQDQDAAAQDLETRSATVAHLQRELGLTRLRAKGLEQALEAKAAAVASLENELGATRRQAAKSEQELEARSAAMARFERELTGARRHIAELGSRLEGQARELLSIKASTSWRVTRPVRWIGAHASLARQLRRALGQIRRVAGRPSELDLIASSGLFDRGWYLEKNPDVRKAGMDPVLHYLRYGGAEGRDPNPLFDSDWYLSHYPDVAAAHVNPLLHYITTGASEGREPNPSFDTRKYLLQNPDVAAARMNPLLHSMQPRRFGPTQG